MNRSSVNSSLSFSPNFTWTSSWSADNKTITIQPTSNLTENTTYNVTARAGALSFMKAALKEDFNWEFRTFTLPVVKSCTPTGQEEPLDRDSSMAFNVPMNRLSVEGSLSFSPSFNWTTSWSNDLRIIKIIPVANLTENTDYTATLHAGALSAVNAPLKDDFTWQFRTFSIPLITYHAPTGQYEPLAPDIMISFNTPMDRVSVNGSISVSPLFSWTAEWSDDNRTITASPVFDLMENTTYTVSVRAGALSGVNAPLAGDFSWNFTTFMVPHVMISSPLGNDVALTSVIAVSFNIAMNDSSVRDSIRTDPDLTYVRQWSDDLRNLTLTNLSLQENTEYNITIMAGARALNGAETPDDYTWTFKTLTYPKVIEFSPTGNNVSISGTVVYFRFNKPMDRASVEGAIQVEPYVKWASPSWTGDTELRFNATLYQPLTKHTITISASARDSTGIHLAAPQSFTFTTGDVPAQPADAPRVVSYSPQGTGVSPTPTIAISFDREMDTFSVLSSISFFPNVSIQDWSKFNTTYHFSLAADLTPNVTYTVMLDVAAKSLAGIFLSAPFSWKFTTALAGAKDADLPTILYTDPSPGEKKVDGAKVITIVFSEAMDPVNTLLSASLSPTVAGNWSWLQGHGVFLQFRPQGTMPVGKYWVVLNSSRARDASSNLLDGNGNGKTDGAADDYSFAFTVGIMQPRLLEKSPEGKGVGLDAPIRMRFDSPMNLSSVRESFTIQPAINGTWTADDGGKTITFTPEGKYRPGKSYRMAFSLPVKDADNNTAMLEVDWQFSSAPAATKVSGELPLWLLVLAIALVIGAAAGIVYAQKRRNKPGRTGEETSAAEEAIPMATPLPAALSVPTTGAECAIENVFLIYRDGRLIQHTTRSIQADMDVEIVTSMLSAVQAFIKDSLGKKESAELGSMEYGASKILMQKGKNIVLAVEISGAEPVGLRDEMKKTVNDVESEFGPVLDGWDGTPAALSGAKRFMTRIGTFRPADAGASGGPKENVSLKAELEFYQGFIRLKVAVKNEGPTLIADASFLLVYSKEAFRLDHIEPAYPYEEVLQFGVVKPREKKTAAFYLDPQICTESYIEGVLTYKDAEDNLETVKLKKLRAAVVCPIVFTDENINTAMLRRMAVEELEQKDTKVFMIPAGTTPQKAFEISKAAVQHHDVRLVREFTEKDPFIGEAWYFGKMKGRTDKMVIRTRVIAEKHVLEFFVASNSTLMLTGMLAELKADLNKELGAQKGRPEMRQVTAPDEVDAVAQVRTLLDKAAGSELAAGDTEMVR